MKELAKAAANLHALSLSELEYFIRWAASSLTCSGGWWDRKMILLISGSISMNGLAIRVGKERVRLELGMRLCALEAKTGRFRTVRAFRVDHP